MTGTSRSSDGLAARRKKLHFRSWHRGMREADLVLGPFADREIAGLSDAELDIYERILEVPDRDLVAWVLGERAVPSEFSSPLLDRIMAAGPGRAA